MSSPLDVESFAKALNSERGLVLSPSAEGFVRKTDDPAVIEFSPSLPVPLCITWVKVPLKMIDKAQPLGKRQCLDHLHDYVVLYFKQPSSPEAAVFAELLQHAAAVQVASKAAATESAADRASCKCGTVISFVSGNPIGSFRVCEPDLWNKLRRELQSWGVPPNGVQLRDC
jgi:hypothetical protein